MTDASRMPVRGVFAASGTPRDERGVLDEDGFRTTLERLLARGVDGFAINGATGEYCLTTPDELRLVARIASEVVGTRAAFICGIGAAGIRACLENAAIAAGAGARAVLLPMPHFFPYEQDDLESFCREVARRSELPVLLYNLPRFTSPLWPETAQALIATCPNIVGIKDSSGSLETLGLLTRSRTAGCRIVGSDDVLPEALRTGVCDGVVSGVASVVPELIVTLYRLREQPDSVPFRDAVISLEEFIAAIAPLPVPWGLKIAAEASGLAAGFSQPLSPRRAEQAAALRQWYRLWQPRTIETTA